MVAQASTGGTRKRSQATQLVDMALHKYKLGVTADGKPFGYTNSAPHVALDPRGNKLGLRQRLARDYFQQHNAAPSQSALVSALNVLEGMAMDQNPTPVHLRVAGDEDAIYIDMADNKNRLIEIADGTWKILDVAGCTVPYMFRRTELTAPMIEPVKGGN